MILSFVPDPRKAVALLSLIACTGRAPAPADTTAAPPPPEPGVDTTAAGSGQALPARAPSPPLSPAADSVAVRLVFVPATQHWFTVAVRRKRFLVDIGRVDLDVSKPPSRLAAYREAVAARSPIPAGTRLRLRGPWGADDVEVGDFDVWNGRIVATLRAPARVDSLSRVDSLVAIAQRTDSATPPRDTACTRAATDSLLARVKQVRDSVLRELDASPATGPGKVSTHASHVIGCFDSGPAVLFLSRYSGDYERVSERALLLTATGAVRALRVRDYRFRAHVALMALDADEDGFDDVAARAFTERAGGTVVLRLADRNRLERLSAGFSWER